MKLFSALLVAGLLTALEHTVGQAAEVNSPIAEYETRPDAGCEPDTCEEDQSVRAARAYLLDTSRPGATMTRQGPELALARLHPEFAKRLATAIQAARNAGLDEAGVFSAYRPPVFGVGGFADKYYSLHAYGLAVDMHGVGRPGSAEAQRWHAIAALHGIVCPYGYNSRVEWNHCQATHLVAVRAENPLRQTIAASGPIDLGSMFETGTRFIADAKSALISVADRSAAVIGVVVARVNSFRGQPGHQRRNLVPTRLAKRTRILARASRVANKAQPRTKVAMLTRQSRRR